MSALRIGWVYGFFAKGKMRMGRATTRESPLRIEGKRRRSYPYKPPLSEYRHLPLGRRRKNERVFFRGGAKNMLAHTKRGIGKVGKRSYEMFTDQATFIFYFDEKYLTQKTYRFIIGT